jgi:hypothetical protein
LDLKTFFDYFFNTYFGYEKWIFTRIIITIIKIIVIMLSPAILIVLISFSLYLILGANLDKIISKILTGLLKNKKRKVDSFVFLFSMESISKINEFSATFYIQLIKMCLHITCFFWIIVAWMLTPFITILLIIFYPWLWISLNLDSASYCLITYLF